MNNLQKVNYLFKIALKTFPQLGNLVYEYNPLHNYRLNRTMIYYLNRLMEVEEFCTKVGISQEDLENKSSWDGIIPKSEATPIVYLKGQLVDFETDELDFSLNNPVDIIPQWSYDNSVNLVINDGKNPPRLINSRFSITKKNLYLVCNRKGTNDTNIYDLGEQFDIDTSLYKKTTTIPRLRFLGLSYGGKLSIGNYHFYFRYVDEDGNESDFFAESGLVSVFIGNSADSIHSGFRNEDSHKQVKFVLTNTDVSYSKINVYYTKATSDINLNATVQAYKILKEYKISLGEGTYLVVSGFEDVLEVTINDINATYQIYGSVETQDTVLNMLFLANVDKPKTLYDDLADCALRFLPILSVSEKYNTKLIGLDYTGSISNTYYDPYYIYNKVGYWDDEIYRFGVVFIKSDNTLTEVFNVRGRKNLSENISESDYSKTEFMKDGLRTYINYLDTNYRIVQTNGTVSEENAKGVVDIQHSGFSTIIGINFILPKEVLDYLKSTLKIKGFFFVRLKRIPTTLCLAYTIGIDKLSHTPVLPVNLNGTSTYIAEGFLSKGEQVQKKNPFGVKILTTEGERYLTHDFDKRIIKLENLQVSVLGAICPEYDVNSPYLNTLFSASEMTCRDCSNTNVLKLHDTTHFTPENFEFEKSSTYSSIKVVGVEDNVKLVAINNNMFSARAGEAEEAFRFEYVGTKNVNTKANNLLRGSFGPYLGITGYLKAGLLIDIKIPGYKPAYMDDYFVIRYNDKSPFYAISDRFDLEHTEWWLNQAENKLYNTLYRGDCYICLFTHRVNRNFLDPSSPTNDDIVDEKCWANNFEVSDGVVKKENFEKINLGDVNAVKLGMYVTLVVRSTMNLNIRAIDSSQTDEVSMFGHKRGFYPFYPMSNSGAYKIPEALCYNKGFEKSLSERVNFEVAEVPWIKNEFSNRIAYSNILVLDAFLNGWRTFVGTHYRDYPKTYGSITKIIEFRGNLLCIFEHGVSLIPINERAIAGEGSGGNIYINTSNVLPENPKIISDIFGSQWKESIIKTPLGVYGVDTVAKKIWRTNGTDFECISDFKVLEFLNLNISLSERELTPIIGIRNVKTHYNAYKKDVMFTFYDNLYGLEEKVWNLCFNETVGWVTFYSWIPSYSGNMYNQYFSFDRNTSKWISKLGVSHIGNDFSDGVVLPNNIIPNEAKSGYRIGELSLANRTLPEGEGISVFTYYTLDRDNLGNFNYFDIKYQKYLIVNNKKSYIGDYVPLEEMLKDPDKNYDSILVLKTDSINLCSELYVRGSNKEISTLETIIAKEGKWKKLSEELYRIYEDNNHSKYTDYNSKIHKCVEKKTTLEVTLNFYSWLNNCVINSNYPIYKDDRGRRILLSTVDKDRRLNGNTIVILLNIKANITVKYKGMSPDIGEAYVLGFTNGTNVDAGYYQSVVAVIPEYNLLFLTTDFWKHGLSGIIDISDKIQPTYWYGKLHPFEFEFVVADNPSAHKIFDDLEIISNNAEPESFHYEIVGDSFDFAKDKKNMYIRQEATKELYLANGFDVTYDHNYIDLTSTHRALYEGAEIRGLYDKSALLPLYYSRQDSVNEVEDYYHSKDNISTKNFSALAGGEIVKYDTLGEYRIWNHAKAVDLLDGGRLRGNMLYKEDKWNVLINPINVVYKNEKAWDDPSLDIYTEYDKDGTIKFSRSLSSVKIPIELGQSPIPDEVLLKGDITYDPNNPTENDIPENSMDRAIVKWNWEESQMKEVKPKDKWIKIRIRYKGDKLAIITAVKTLYSISYS